MDIKRISYQDVLARLKYRYNPPELLDDSFKREWYEYHQVISNILRGIGRVGDGLEDDDDFTLGEQCIQSRTFGIQVLNRNLFNGNIVVSTHTQLLRFSFDYEVYLSCPYDIDGMLADMFINRSETLIRSADSVFARIVAEIGVNNQ